MNVFEIIQKDNYVCAFCNLDDEKLQTHSLNFSSRNAQPVVTICEDCLADERKYRREEEKKLIEELKAKRFSFTDVSQIAWAFGQMKEFNNPGKMASVIRWVLEDDVLMQQLNDLYDQKLSENNYYPDDLPF